MDSNKRIPSVVATTKQANKTTSLMQSMSSKQQQQNLQPLLQQSLITNPIRPISNVSAISNLTKKMDCPLL
jgi:histone acetyltransferase (RNA polymerase elongator complex component)